MLAVQNLECVRGERRLFSALGFELAPGALLQIEGSNGSGKTSLLRMLCGLLPPSAGEIRWRGQPIAELGEQYRAEIAYLGHENAVKEELSALENVALSTRLRGDNPTPHSIAQALDTFGLQGRERLPAKYLSQGQRRRVSLTCLSLTRSALWLLDEPFNALDVRAVKLVADLLARHLQSGGIALISTHRDVAIPGATMRRLRLDS
jgi:heme exporter protein A